MKKSTDRKIFRAFCWFALTLVCVLSIGWIFLSNHVRAERDRDAIENRIRFAESLLLDANNDNERAAAQARLESALIERDRLNR